MSGRVTIKDAKTPLGQSLVDDVNDAIRVAVVAGSGGGMSDAEFAAHLPLHVIVDSGAGAGTQYADAVARGTATGTLAMGDDGTNIQSVKVDTAGVLAIQDNSGSITVDGTFFQVTQPVSVAAVVHVDDNADSLTVDGSVTANAGTNLNTSLLALESGNLALVAAVLGTEDDGAITLDDTGTIASRLLSMSTQLNNLIDLQKETQLLLLQMAFALEAISKNQPYEVH